MIVRHPVTKLTPGITNRLSKAARAAYHYSDVGPVQEYACTATTLAGILDHPLVSDLIDAVALGDRTAADAALDRLMGTTDTAPGWLGRALGIEQEQVA